MNQQEIKDYLERLKEIENQLNSDEEIDSDLIGEINNVLNVLNDDVLKETTNQNVVKQNMNEVLVKVKKLNSSAVIPKYSKIGDAGMDLTAIDIEITDDYISYKTGLAFEIPRGYVGLLFPRSSNCKKDLLLTNSVGVLDSGFRGEVEVRYKKIYNENKEYKLYDVGERVGQIMILPYPEVYMAEVLELSNSDRGQGGFGSTGK